MPCDICVFISVKNIICLLDICDLISIMKKNVWGIHFVLISVKKENLMKSTLRKVLFIKINKTSTLLFNNTTWL